MSRMLFCGSKSGSKVADCDEWEELRTPAMLLCVLRVLCRAKRRSFIMTIYDNKSLRSLSKCTGSVLPKVLAQIYQACVVSNIESIWECSLLLECAGIFGSASPCFSSCSWLSLAPAQRYFHKIRWFSMQALQAVYCLFWFASKEAVKLSNSSGCSLQALPPRQGGYMSRSLKIFEAFWNIEILCFHF